MALQPPLIKTLVEVRSARVPKSSSKCLGNKKAFIMLTNTSMNLHQQSTKESIVHFSIILSMHHKVEIYLKDYRTMHAAGGDEQDDGAIDELEEDH